MQPHFESRESDSFFKKVCMITSYCELNVTQIQIIAYRSNNWAAWDSLLDFDMNY